jgi:drug/metabolite transporter (DMT)-like permease
VGEALSLLSLLLFSSNALLVTVAAPRLGQDVGFLLALGSNVLFSGLLVLSQHLILGRGLDVHWAPLVMFAIGGLFTSYFGRRLFFLSVQSIGPSRATSLQITNPVFAAIISWLFLGEVLGSSAIGFIAAVIIGLYLTTRVPTARRVPVAVATDGAETRLPDLEPDPPATAHTGLPKREVVLALVGAFSYAVGNVVRSSGVREWNEPILGGFVGAVAGTLAYLLLHTKVRSLVDTVRKADRAGVWLWTLSGVLTISAQVSLMAATRHIPIAVGVVVSAALPIIVIPVSVLLLNNKEAVTGRTVMGGLLILAGVAGLLLA